MEPTGPKLDQMIAQVRNETGARVFVLGEQHDSRNSVQYLRDSLKDLKAQGVQTLYVEMSSDLQPLLDDALKGDPKAQYDLHTRHETWWGTYGGHDAAQQRYDLLFEANKAGIRVKAMDMQTQGDYLHRFNELASADGTVKPMSGRFTHSDAVMSRNVKALDDGGAAIVLVGRAHTYQYNPAYQGEDLGISGTTPEGKMESQIVNSELHRSPYGGLDTRLNAMGIKTVSMDYTVTNGDTFQLAKGDGFQNDYKILLPKEDIPENPDSNYAAHTRNGWGRLADVYEQAALQSQTRGYNDIAQGLEKTVLDLRDLAALVDSPAFLEKPADVQAAVLNHKAAILYNDPVNQLIPITPETAASLGMPRRNMISAETAFEKLKDTPLDTARQVYEGTLDSVDWNRFVRDNQALHDQGAEANWKRDPMPLAGEASTRTHTTEAPRHQAYQIFTEAPDIRTNWQTAQTATAPLGQTDTPADDPSTRPAPQPLRHNF